jgi:hypothetical protein
MDMSISPVPKWSLRVLLPRQRWSRSAFAWSFGLHAIGFGVVGWVMRGEYLVSAPPVLHTTRAYALHYLVLSRPRPRHRPESRPEPRPERRPVSRPDLVIRVRAQMTPVSTLPTPGGRTEPVPSALQIRELPPGAVAGVGQVISAPGSDASNGPGLMGKLGFRVPEPGEVGLPKRGLDRVAELLAGAGSACPELRPPVGLAHRGLAVTVAFVVDTHGVVDRNTLRVIESPSRPQTEHQFQSHIYVVGAKVRPDQGRIDPAAYDSVVSREVASHVADLMFRPALKEGRTVRSTVLISCQTSRAD